MHQIPEELNTFEVLFENDLRHPIDKFGSLRPNHNQIILSRAPVNQLRCREIRINAHRRGDNYRESVEINKQQTSCVCV